MTSKESYPDENENFHLQELKGFEDAYHKIERNLNLAIQHEGETLFDLIIKIIQDHPDIELRLE